MKMTDRPVVIFLSAVVGAFLSGVGALLWLDKYIQQKINSDVVPINAVVAFNSKKCPEDLGWEEYTAAYGRFVRGIDNGTPTIDPDKKRSPGHIQVDQVQTHVHRITPQIVQSHSFTPSASEFYAPTIGKSSDNNNFPDSTPPLKSNTGSETRPKNVALLFCEKKRYVKRED